MDMGSIAAALGGLKSAGDIAKAFLELKSDAERQAKVIELQSVILAAQTSAIAAQSDQFSMLEQIRALKEEVAKAKAWEEESKRYELRKLPSGALIRSLKKEGAKGEPPHSICTTCHDQGKKTILQEQNGYDGGAMFICPVCKTNLFEVS
jgi:hypothetical protein